MHEVSEHAKRQAKGKKKQILPNKSCPKVEEKQMALFQTPI